MNPMRLEYKFLVPLNRLNELREAIRPFVFLDEYAEREKNNEYTVRSIYYDTMRLDDYRDKISGIKVRKKLRIRGYNEKKQESVVFLEVKRKSENYVAKNRAPLLYNNLDLLLNTSDCENYLIKKKSYLDAKNDAMKFFYLLKLKNCSPVALITYEREAYFSKHDTTLRITIDKNLRSSALPNNSELYRDTGLKLAMPGYLIIEIKFFNGFPHWLQKIISSFELNRRALSKYTICVDNHYELNRFVNKRDLLVSSIINGTKIQDWKKVIINAG
jgi:hypothetical protein